MPVPILMCKISLGFKLSFDKLDYTIVKWPWPIIKVLLVVLDLVYDIFFKFNLIKLKVSKSSLQTALQLQPVQTNYTITVFGLLQEHVNFQMNSNDMI